MSYGTATLKIARHVLTGCLLASAGAFAAPPFPSKPMVVVVPYLKGGGPDRLVRMVTRRMSADLGQPVHVENRPGMAGILGVAEVSRAAPDGYTMVYANNITLSYAEVTHGRLIYRPDELVPVVLLLRVADGIAVPVHSDIKDLDDLSQRARAAPGRITYTTPGRGASSNLSASLLARAAGMRWQYVPASDSFQAARMIARGDVDVLVDNVTMLLPQVLDGKVRVLATTGAARAPLLPGVPTLTESTKTRFENFGWGGFVAPHGTPPDVVARLNASANRALADPATQEALQSAGAEAMGGPPEQLQTMARQERALWNGLTGVPRANP